MLQYVDATLIVLNIKAKSIENEMAQENDEMQASMKRRVKT